MQLWASLLHETGSGGAASYLRGAVGLSGDEGAPSAASTVGRPVCVWAGPRLALTASGWCGGGDPGPEQSV